jgi:predicted Rossmann fold flavoprotein
LTDDSAVTCDRLLIATGGNRSSAGLVVAEQLGHVIEPTVPSLFTFHIDDKRLEGLSGIAVDNVTTAVPGTRLRESGPLLITHWGLSGPAVLKLSAWGARELAACKYEFTLRLNFTPPHTRESLLPELAALRQQHPRKQVATWNPFGLPQRLWERLLVMNGFDAAKPWTGVSNDALARLAGALTAADFTVVGKSLNKEEFVTCGGVRLREVDFKTMESKVCPGLYFAGEVLDVDGITGGFNFQAAWTTGRLAGLAMAG